MSDKPTENDMEQTPEPETIARRRHCAPKVDTKDRLFGTTNGSVSRKVRNNPTFKSAIFGSDPPSPARTSKKQIPVIERNPITGEVKIPPRVTV